MRRLTQARSLYGAALVAWAGLFWFLILDGRTPMYISKRTEWLVYLGAATTTLGAIGYLAFGRGGDRRTATARDVRALAIFLLPVVLLVALPPVSLDSFAASRRATVAGEGLVSGAGEGIGSGDLSLIDVAGALSSAEGRHALARRAGASASFTGFVARDSGQPADEFTLTRFLITCCPGDALGIQIRVVGAPPGRFEPDDWVRATGKLYPLGKQVILDASEVVAVPRPKRPYLNP